MKKWTAILLITIISTSSAFALSRQQKLKYWAGEILKSKKRRISIRGKKFPMDCSNFVRAVYFGATGKSLFKEAVDLGIYTKVKKAGGFGSSFGVVLLYVLFKHQYTISKKAKVGDIVFFDNTYDKNRNKKWDDVLTHAGVVTAVDSDGTVTFVHGGTSKGVVKGFLNTREPDVYRKDGKVLNSYLQRRYRWSRQKKLTGGLVRGFGRF